MISLGLYYEIYMSILRYLYHNLFMSILRFLGMVLTGITDVIVAKNCAVSTEL